VLGLKLSKQRGGIKMAKYSITQKYSLLGIILLLLFIFSGCTATIQPVVSESEYLTSATKKSGRAELYVSEEFRKHTETKTDVMDMKKWEYELGPASVDCFKYALSSRFEKVDVKLGTPSFPMEGEVNRDLLVVVEPAFLKFDTHYPVAFKFETYTVAISYKVKAYDRSGKLILENVYEGVGEKRGSIGTASAGHAAGPVATKLAVKNAVDKAVFDIMEAIEKK
jgi:hypothetical protein